MTALQATIREETGKGPARRLREKDLVPGIIYGAGKPEIKITLPLKELTKEYHRGSFLSRMIDVEVGKESYHVLPRDIHLHPVSDLPIHVDFLLLDDDSTINVWVKVRFINLDSCPGIKRGGVLNVVRHTIELVATPKTIPAECVFDLGELNIGDALHISHTTLPEGVTPVIEERDFTIATIAGRTKETADTDAGDAGDDAAAATEEEASEEKQG
jgi:large subunit ribosomal protein L25